MNKDLIFLGRQFETFEIPKDKRYLLKYFDTPPQELFLKYFLSFGNFDHFVDHTGVVLQVRWMKILKQKLELLLALHAEAKKNFDLSGVAKIESGKYRLKI